LPWKRKRKGKLSEAAATKVFFRSSTGTGGSTIVCVRLEGDSPIVEEFELPLRLAAGRDIWRGTALVTTTQFTGDFFWLLSPFVAV